MKYIIIQLANNKALYGFDGLTLLFSTELAAEELGTQMCRSNGYIVVPIKILDGSTLNKILFTQHEK